MDLTKMINVLFTVVCENVFTATYIGFTWGGKATIMTRKT